MQEICKVEKEQHFFNWFVTYQCSGFAYNLIAFARLVFQLFKFTYLAICFVLLIFCLSSSLHIADTINPNIIKLMNSMSPSGRKNQMPFATLSGIQHENDNYIYISVIILSR